MSPTPAPSSAVRRLFDRKAFRVSFHGDVDDLQSRLNTVRETERALAALRAAGEASDQVTSTFEAALRDFAEALTEALGAKSVSPTEREQLEAARGAVLAVVDRLAS